MNGGRAAPLRRNIVAHPGIGVMIRIGNAAESRPEDYWQQSRRPLVSLGFLLPLLLAYEIGIVAFGGPNPEAIRNGADYWMRGWLAYSGMGYPLVLPALVLTVLLCWHLISGDRWRFSVEVPAGMLAESVLFGFLLVVIGQLADMALRSIGHLPVGSMNQGQASLAVTYLGAGIYEEFLFRLCLLPACYGLLRTCRLNAAWSAAVAILASGLTFSLAHYVGPAAEPLALFTFVFRALAGVFFGLLFVLRGFGITVGSHAAYDLLVGILLKT